MYTLLIVLILILFPLDKGKNKTLYIIAITLLLIVIGGFRSEMIGTDTPGYVQNYLISKYYWWDWHNRLNENEPLFYAFQHTLSSAGYSYTVFLTFVAAFYYSVIAIFIRRFSKDARLSFLLFIALGQFLFSMAGIRQTLAMGFQLLCFMSLLDKKYLKSVIYLLLACGFHITSIAFAIVYLLPLIPLSWPFVLVIIALTFLGFTTGGNYAVMAAEMLWGSKRLYAESDGGTSVFLILCVLSAFSLYIYWKYYRHERKDDNNGKVAKSRDLDFISLSIKMLLVALVFQAVSNKQADIFRVTYMFDITAIALIPNEILKLKPTPRKIAYWSLVVLIIARWYLLPAGKDFYPYRFFWE